MVTAAPDIRNDPTLSINKRNKSGVPSAPNKKPNAAENATRKDNLGFNNS
jgi:hypothetical protein